MLKSPSTSEALLATRGDVQHNFTTQLTVMSLAHGEQEAIENHDRTIEALHVTTAC